jgi:hypothetical protein
MKEVAMAWRSLLPFLASALVGFGFGCANVKVHKVPVADRVAETDNHVKGFRYYLNRPYLAVTRKVPISTTYIPTAIAAYYPKFPDKTSYEIVLVSQIPKDGRFEVYDGQGQLRREIDAGSKSVILIAVKTSGNDTPSGLKLDVAQDIITVAFRKSFDEYVKTKKIKMDPTDTDYSPVVAAIIGKSDTPNSVKQDLQNFKSDYKTIAERAVDRGIAPANDLLKKLEKPVDPTFATDKRQKMIDDIVAKLSAAAAPAAPKSDSPAVAPALVYADSGQTDSKKDPAATPPPSPDAFQVAFLPDFEEQYAIHNCNFLAVTKYKYTFRNGTELVSMAGSYDATDVPVKILETVGKLVEAAGAVGKAKLGGGIAKADLALTTAGGGTANFWIRTERAIEPGLYRIQKSWERIGGTKVEEIQPDHACGLLSDVGLPIVTSVSVISKDQHDKETQSLYK